MRNRAADTLRKGPLSSAGFRWIWVGEAVSAAGTQFHLVALPWLTLQLSGSGVAVGAVLAAAAVPRALLLVVGGALTDRWSARTAMLLSNAVRAALAAMVAAAVAAGWASMPLLYAAGVLFGMADAVFHPAHAALVPRLVSREQLAAANSLIQGSRQAIGVVTPGLAGLVVAANGAAAAFVIDAATFAFAAAALLRVEEGARPDARRKILDEIPAGLHYVRTHRHLGALLASIAAINVAFAGPFVVGAASLADRQFGGAPGLGWLLSSLAAGGLFGTALAAPLYRRCAAVGGLVAGGMLLMAAALGALAVAPRLPHAGAAAALGGIAAGALNPSILASLQRDTPAPLHGRVMALAMLGALGLAPLSYGAAALLIPFGTKALFVTAGVTLASATAVLARPLLRGRAPVC